MTQVADEIYKEVVVFKREEDGPLTVYFCVESLSNQHFYMIYSAQLRPGHESKDFSASHTMFLTILMDQSPVKYLKAYQTMKELAGAWFS